MNLNDKRQKFFKDLDYALGKFDWGNSALDADAIRILNEWKSVLIEQDKEFIKKLRQQSFGVICTKDTPAWEVFDKIIKDLAGEELWTIENSSD